MQIFDLPPAAQKHFPTHGWIRGQSGYRHLRLPIMRLFQLGQPTYDRFVQKRLAGRWLQSKSPYRTLRQLAVGLRDLHQNLREMRPIVSKNWLERKPSNARDTALNRLHEGYERAEISLIAVFVLLRRLADDLTSASRPLLFEDWKSAPEELKVAIAAANKGTLKDLKPICNLDVLTDALQNHTAWLAQLRKGGDAIRDILVHSDHVLQVGPIGIKRPGDAGVTWQIRAVLQHNRQGTMRSIDLFPALVECVAGACRFMDRLYCCATPPTDYQRGDCLFLTGSDSDVIGFWPSIRTANRVCAK